MAKFQTPQQALHISLPRKKIPPQPIGFSWKGRNAMHETIVDAAKLAYQSIFPKTNPEARLDTGKNQMRVFHPDEAGTETAPLGIITPLGTRVWAQNMGRIQLAGEILTCVHLAHDIRVNAIISGFARLHSEMLGHNGGRLFNEYMGKLKATAKGRAKFFAMALMEQEPEMPRGRKGIEYESAVIAGMLRDLATLEINPLELTAPRKNELVMPMSYVVRMEELLNHGKIKSLLKE
jgi:hypothetical protein